MLQEIFIDNFGLLHNFHHSFSEGINPLFDKNGAGKTTLAVFIISMFYGISDDKKNDISDRVHYLPWQGGTYGGSLTFSNGTKSYRISRTFGKTAKDDTFILYDTATEKESHDYSKNLGEELFGVSRKTYEKSAFIRQGFAQNYDGQENDTIAKLSGLVENSEKSVSCDKALSILEKQEKYYTNRSSGTITKNDKQLGDLRKKSYAIDADLNTINEWNKAKKEKEKQLEEICIEKNNTKKLLDELKTNNLASTSIDQYEGAIKEKASVESSLDTLVHSFGTYIPSNDELNDIKNTQKEWKSQKDKLNDFVLSKEEIEELSSVQAYTKLSEERQKKKNLPLILRLLPSVLGLIFLIYCVNAATPYVTYSYIGLAIGILLSLVLSLIRYDQREKPQNLPPRIMELQKKKAYYEECKAPILESIQTSEAKIKAFLQLCHVEEVSSDYLAELFTIENKLKSIADLKQRKESLQSHIDSFQNNSDLQAIISTAHPTRTLKQNEDDFLSKLQDLEISERTLHNEISNIEARIQSLSSHMSSKADLEEQIEIVSAQLDADRKTADILEKTKYLLMQAKSALSTRYLSTMQASYEKNLAQFCQDHPLPAVLNSDLKVEISDGSQKRSGIFYSEGTKDILSFCMHMSLVDALYKDTSPVILLDDPFTDLDEENLMVAKDFLKKYGKQRQILYFTCHRSRM